MSYSRFNCWNSTARTAVTDIQSENGTLTPPNSYCTECSLCTLWEASSTFHYWTLRCFGGSDCLPCRGKGELRFAPLAASQSISCCIFAGIQFYDCENSCTVEADVAVVWLSNHCVLILPDFLTHTAGYAKLRHVPCCGNCLNGAGRLHGCGPLQHGLPQPAPETLSAARRSLRHFPPRSHEALTAARLRTKEPGRAPLPSRPAAPSRRLGPASCPLSLVGLRKGVSSLRRYWSNYLTCSRICQW